MSGDAWHLIFRVHAVQRMFERGVSANDVGAVLAAGESVWCWAGSAGGRSMSSLPRMRPPERWL